MTINIPTIGSATIGSLQEPPDGDFLTLSEVADIIRVPGQHAALVASARGRAALLQNRPSTRHHRR